MLDHLIRDYKIEAGVGKRQVFSDTAHKHRCHEPLAGTLDRRDLGSLPDPILFQPEGLQAASSARDHEAADTRTKVEYPRIGNRNLRLDLAQRSFRIAMDDIFDDLSLRRPKLNPFQFSRRYSSNRPAVPNR